MLKNSCPCKCLKRTPNLQQPLKYARRCTSVVPGGERKQSWFLTALALSGVYLLLLLGINCAPIPLWMKNYRLCKVSLCHSHHAGLGLEMGMGMGTADGTRRAWLPLLVRAEMGHDLHIYSHVLHPCLALEERFARRVLPPLHGRGDISHPPWISVPRRRSSRSQK